MMSLSQQKADTETENQTLCLHPLPVKIEPQDIKQNIQQQHWNWVLKSWYHPKTSAADYYHKSLSPRSITGLSWLQHTWRQDDKILHDDTAICQDISWLVYTELVDKSCYSYNWPRLENVSVLSWQTKCLQSLQTDEQTEDRTEPNTTEKKNKWPLVSDYWGCHIFQVRLVSTNDNVTICPKGSLYKRANREHIPLLTKLGFFVGQYINIISLYIFMMYEITSLERKKNT